jgi:hypothetical protein
MNDNGMFDDMDNEVNVLFWCAYVATNSRDLFNKHEMEEAIVQSVNLI